MNYIKIIFFYLLTIIFYLTNPYLCFIINILLPLIKIIFKKILDVKIKEQIEDIIKEENGKNQDVNLTKKIGVGPLKLTLSLDNLVFNNLELKDIDIKYCNSEISCLTINTKMIGDVIVTGSLSGKEFKLQPNNFITDVEININLLYDQDNEEIFIKVKKLDVSKSQLKIETLSDDLKNMINKTSIYKNGKSACKKIADTAAAAKIKACQVKCKLLGGCEKCSLIKPDYSLCQKIDSGINKLLAEVSPKMEKIINDEIKKVIQKIDTVEELEELSNKNLKSKLKIEVPNNLLIQKILKCLFSVKI